MEKQTLKKLLAKGKIKQVIVELLELTKDDADLYNQVVQQSTFFDNYEKSRTQPNSNTEQLHIQLAKINSALLYIIDNLPEKNRRLLFIKIFLLLAIPLFIIILVFQGYFSEKDITVAVYVRAKGDQSKKILAGEGEVCLYLKTKPDCRPIDNNGEAIFTQVSPNFKNKSIRIEIKHPNQPFQVVEVEKTYLIKDNEAIYVEIELKNNDRVYGRVQDADDNFLSNVRVSIQNVDTFTDKNGWFDLTIPEGKQLPNQIITFEKVGFKNKILKNIPIHTLQDMSVQMEKK